MTASLIIKAPARAGHHSPHYKPPSSDWLLGTWHVTHSTLPMWKSKRNVRITYKSLHPGSESVTEGTDRIDDTVSYQTLTSDKVKTIRGIDKASGSDASAWDWRGKGWLAMISSHWEVLGFGTVDTGTVRTGDDQDSEVGPPEQWLVTYFAKTPFTPAGIDIYSRSGIGLSSQTLAKIKQSLAAVEDEEVKRLAGNMFEIKRDGPRSR